jgi:CheY-like chemotaxis protein
MVINDDRDTQYLAAHRIKQQLGSCTLFSYPSADAALAALKTTPVDVIITDNHLGDITGSEFIGRARKRGLTCPIIMVTESSDPAVRMAAYAAGATEVFAAGQGDYVTFLETLFRLDQDDEPKA